MGRVSARPVVGFEGRSLHDDEHGGARVDEAVDALARLAVLTAITEDQVLAESNPEIVDRARQAITRLAAGGSEYDEEARQVSRDAAGARGSSEPYELRFKIELEIVTRPYNQWVRDVVATGTPIGG
jgi:hypothetical protein